MKEGNVQNCYVLAHKMAKRSKPFCDGEFIKECLVDSVAILCLVVFSKSVPLKVNCYKVG